MRSSTANRSRTCWPPSPASRLACLIRKRSDKAGESSRRRPILSSVLVHEWQETANLRRSIRSTRLRKADIRCLALAAIKTAQSTKESSQDRCSLAVLVGTFGRDETQYQRR